MCTLAGRGGETCAAQMRWVAPSELPSSHSFLFHLSSFVAAVLHVPPRLVVASTMPRSAAGPRVALPRNRRWCRACAADGLPPRVASCRTTIVGFPQHATFSLGGGGRGREEGWEGGGAGRECAGRGGGALMVGSGGGGWWQGPASGSSSSAVAAVAQQRRRRQGWRHLSGPPSRIFLWGTAVGVFSGAMRLARSPPYRQLL